MIAAHSFGIMRDTVKALIAEQCCLTIWVCVGSMVQVFKGVFYSTLLICSFSLLFRSYVLFQSKFYSSGAESIGLYGILDVAEGGNLYRTPNERPYSAFVFTPLYPLTIGNLLKALQIKNKTHQILFIKGVGVLMALILFYLFWNGASKIFPKSNLVILLALILSSSRLFDYIGTTRNDMAALVAEFLTLHFFGLFIDSKKKSHLWVFILFSIVGIWTRQTAIIAFASAMIWLVVNRRFKIFLGSTAIWLLINTLILALLLRIYGNSLFDHIIYANVRLWKDLDKSLITTSLLSFGASLGIFLILFFSKLRGSLSLPQGTVKQFYCLCLFFGTLFGGITYFRAGGDVNYLFFPLLLGGYFILNQVSYFLEKPWGIVLLSLQLGLIAFIFIQKSRVALNYSNLPYASFADKIEKRFPTQGLITGHYAQNMGIHLKSWAHHGPDLTNGVMVSLSSHKKLNWLVTDAMESIQNGTIHALIDANPGCAGGPSQNYEWFTFFPKKEVWADWLCVYTRK